MVQPFSITTLMIHFKSGDLLQSPDTFIAQGVAVGSQEGLGIYLVFSQKYLYVLEQDKKPKKGEISIEDVLT